MVLGKPYDVRLKLNGKERHVEVKGSWLAIDTVELTRNEVDHAQGTETADLVVVDEIEWSRNADGDDATSGGRRRIWTDWEPVITSSTPRKYAYQLPPDDHAEETMTKRPPCCHLS